MLRPIAPSGNNSNSGMAEAPFETVQRGLSVLQADDAIYIKAVTYDLGGYSKTYKYKVNINVDGSGIVTLENAGTLTFNSPADVNFDGKINVKDLGGDDEWVGGESSFVT